MSLRPVPCLGLSAVLALAAAASPAPAQGWGADDRSDRPRWVKGSSGEPVPRNALEGGRENGRPLYVCRADKLGGRHPGKLVGGKCNFGYAGREESAVWYEVLVDARGRWVPADRGLGDAYAGGEEDGKPLLLCRAGYKGGVHPGKVVGARCNIGYGGQEVVLGDFDVFVLGSGSDSRDSRGWRDDEPPPAREGAPVTICADQPVPYGGVILKMGRDMKCPDWSATGFNTQTIKRPGASEEVCGNSPIPRGYVVEGEGLSWDCPGWTATGKNTKKIRRF